MNAKEQLLREIQNAPESIVTQLLEILQSLKQQFKEQQTSEIINYSSPQNLDNDPLLSVIGIFDTEAISSVQIDKELYE